MNTAAPINFTAQVCLLCGSPSPDEAAADCSHERVARFCELPSDLRALVLRIRQARAFVSTSLATLAEAAKLEEGAGRAVIDTESATYSPGSNVLFLNARRGELVRNEPAPPSKVTIRPAPAAVEPPKAKPSAVAGKPLVLKPAKIRKRSKASPPPPAPKKPGDTATGDLFDA